MLAASFAACAPAKNYPDAKGPRYSGPDARERATRLKLATLNIRGERSVTCRGDFDRHPSKGPLPPGAPPVCEVFRHYPDALERAAELDAAYGRDPDLETMPVYGVVLAWLLLDERLYAFHLAGIALVVVGIWLASRGPARAKATEDGPPESPG